MPRMTFAVYGPPSPELPNIAVVLSDGEVIIAEPVNSPQEGEQLIRHLSEELAKKAANEGGQPTKPSDQCPSQSGH